MTDIPDSVIRNILATANYGVTHGRDDRPEERALYRRCTHFHYRTGTIVIYTRDSGMHTSGWMKNPDYERCRHLSVSFRRPFPERAADQLGKPHIIAQFGGILELAPFDRRVANTWVRAILGDDARYAWEEGPFSDEGKQLDVRHWRVFCDPSWQAILPKGEVYSRVMPAGWRSWSEVQGEDAAPNWVDAS